MDDPTVGTDRDMDSIRFVGTATTVITLGSFTVLTDPNFLRRGQRAYLGWGLSSRRLTDPALQPDQLPSLDAVVLSHLHGDHFDRVSRRHLDRTPPVLSTPSAVRRLDRWGFAGLPMQTWDQHTIDHGEDQLRITSLPATHARGVLGRMLPPVMGSMLELVRDGSVVRSVYVSGDTLMGPDVEAVKERYPQIDTALVHLGGTRVLFRTVTMDAEMGADFVSCTSPSVTVPVHFDDYGVFRSPLSDFLALTRARGLGEGVRVPARGGVVPLDHSDA